MKCENLLGSSLQQHPEKRNIYRRLSDGGTIKGILNMGQGKESYVGDVAILVT